MLEFSISNQLLSRLDATKVVADSENYLECAFRFSKDWDGAVAVATFGHSKVSEPISVRIVDGKCQVPHEVIQPYGFQLAVYGTTGEDGTAVCRIPTNVVTVEVENSGPGQDLGPTTPSKTLYDTLMTAIAAGEKAASEAKTSALASAEAAQDAQKGAQKAQAAAGAAADNAATSATAGAKDALTARAACEEALPVGKRMEAMLKQARSYVLGGDVDKLVHACSNISWKNGELSIGCMFLDPGKRYRVRVNNTWYETSAQWVLEEKCRIKEDDQAELTGLSAQAGIDTSETPETPGGDEVNTGGSGNTGGGGTGETPETPGGDEVISGGGDNAGTTPVVQPTLRYERVKDIVKLVAGPVTVEDVMLNKETGESQICWLRSSDLTVREVEVRTVGNANAKYFYEQAMEAAARAEAAAQRIEAQA